MCSVCLDSEGYVKEGYMKCYGCHTHLKYRERNKADAENKKETPKQTKRKNRLQYLREFRRIRPQVMERDNHKCVRCGEDKKTLHVHHKKHKSDGGTNEIDNLITLCSTCHKLEHANERVFLIMGD